MAQQTINNGESGLITRGKINDNFTELYSLLSSVTEKKNYYNGEIRVNRMINTSTGATTSNTGYDVTDFIEITANESITIKTSDASAMTVYGWTYDSSFTAISEIRSNALIGTTLTTYTFTTPANAKYLLIYTRNGSTFSNISRGWADKLRIESTNTITYSAPLFPENFSGADITEKIQAALDFARWTSSPVFLNGNYEIDATLIVYSGTKLVINGKVKAASGLHDNIIRNEAVRSTIINRGNKNIKIIGNGGLIEGSDEAWGSGTPSGVGSEYWRPIGILLANVDVFEISGLRVKSTAMWGMCCEQCRYGSIKDITFFQDGRQNNQDGINIRRGSHHITIENIKGTSYDDLIALTNLVAYTQYNVLTGTTVYDPLSTALDIHDITIKNVQADPHGYFTYWPHPQYRSALSFITEDALKMYNINVDGVHGCLSIRVGETGGSGYWSSVQATVDDMYNMSFNNVFCPIYVRRPIKNSSYHNIQRLDYVNVTASAPVLNGSLNISRKYLDGDYEFFTSIGSFDPTSIANCEIWYDVSDSGSVTKDGSNLVSQLNDKSGNSYHVSESGSARPTWVSNQINQKPTIRFSGSTALRRAKITNLQNIASITAFIVGGNGIPSVWHGFDFSNRTQFEGGTPLGVICNAGSSFGTIVTIPHHTTAQINCFVYDGSQSTNATRLRLNLSGVSKTLTFTGTIPATTENNASSKFGIGVIDNSTPVYRAGDFAEFILYLRVLSDAEILQVTNYLRSKWGL